MQESNVVALMGVAVTELTDEREINGTKIKCQHITVETKRNSGTADLAEVYITDKTENELLTFSKGCYVMVIGKIQTAKDFKTNHVLTFVAADFVGVVNEKGFTMQNDIKLTGKLGKGITYRTRHSGKRITTIMLEIDSVFRANTKCYIPCICWQKVADEVKDWQVGDEVELTGRLQSREFTKHTDDRDIERTSYEVSIFNIAKVDERQQ